MTAPGPDGGLIAAFLLDGDGGGQPVGWDAVRDPAQGPLWVHLDYGSSLARDFIETDQRIPDALHEALLDSNPRPRSALFGDGLLVVLRSVNGNAEAEPEDMVALRMFVTERFVVTVRRRRLLAVQEIVDAVGRGEGPRSPAELPWWIIDNVNDRLRVVVEAIDEEADELEETLIAEARVELRGRIASLRRRAIALRRYLVPQKEALSRLAADKVSWLDEEARAGLREQAERLTRLLEDLDSARERAAVTQEELSHRQAERTGRTMYLLSILSSIFLPLTFLTGLLGINVGGIPGAQHGAAFPVVAGVLLVLALLEVLVLRRGRWL